MKRLITASLMALLLLPAVPAHAQVDEWRVLAEKQHRAGVRVDSPTIEGTVNAVRFQAGYRHRRTGPFAYVVSVDCGEGYSWSDSGVGRDTKHRFWQSRIFDLSDVPANVACYAHLQVKAPRELRAYKMYGAILGHYTA